METVGKAIQGQHLQSCSGRPALCNRTLNPSQGNPAQAENSTPCPIPRSLRQDAAWTSHICWTESLCQRSCPIQAAAGLEGTSWWTSSPPPHPPDSPSHSLLLSKLVPWVGWSTTRDYYTFLWAPPPSDYQEQTQVAQHLVFQAYYLPKEDGEFYQFCYVDSCGLVRGASTPFRFQGTPESSLEADLLVVTTQALARAERQRADRALQEVTSVRSVHERELAERQQIEEDLQHWKHGFESMKERLDKTEEEKDLLLSTKEKSQEPADQDTVTRGWAS
ncbi:UNVERIFIED_CONTAM: hypothetical protein FKN15_010072 [Acipenser sinensis]